MSHPYLHGFGERYDLPIPLGVYLYAAAGVVVVSFLIVVVFANLQGEAGGWPRRDAPWLVTLARSRLLTGLGRLVGVLGLAATVLCGILGSPQPLRNPAAYLVWIYLWVGLVLLSALIGNVWPVLNPFDTLHRLLARLLRLRPRLRPYPAGWGIWPAALAFFLIAWLELASGKASVPALVGWLALAYTLYTLAGMTVFGRRQWLEHGEAYTVLFGVASRFAPLRLERDEEGHPRRGEVRLWGGGLLEDVRPGWDRIVFVILMLSNLAFDGIEATPAWFNLIQSQPALPAALGPWWHPLVYTAGIVAVALFFVVVFTLFMRAVIALGRLRVDHLTALTAFAYTLVPIALVYDFAHNYTYLTLVGQEILPTLADPLGKGWNLLPTAGYQPSYAIDSPATVWLMQVVLIVIGHVLAVLLAHFRAAHWAPGARAALLSQYPMLLLMVAYTMTSLWILAQPITNAG